MYEKFMHMLNAVSSGHTKSLRDLMAANTNDSAATIQELSWISSHVDLEKALRPTNLVQIKDWIKENGTLTGEEMPELEYNSKLLREVADRHCYDLLSIRDEINSLPEEDDATKILKAMAKRRVDSLIQSAAIAASVLNGEADKKADHLTSKLLEEKYKEMMLQLDALYLFADNNLRYIKASYEEIDGWMQHVKVDAQKMKHYLNGIIQEYQLSKTIKVNIGVGIFDNGPVETWIESEGARIVIDSRFEANAVQAFLIALGDIECTLFDKLNYAELMNGIPLVDEDMLYSGHRLHYIAQAERKLCGYSCSLLDATISIFAAKRAKDGSSFLEIVDEIVGVLCDQFGFNLERAFEQASEIAARAYSGCRKPNDRIGFCNPVILSKMAGYRMSQELADAGMFRFLTLGLSSLDDIIDVASNYSVNVGDLTFKKRSVAEELAKKLT